MSDRTNGGDTNVTNILKNAPDVDALEQGEVMEIDLFPAEAGDGTMTVGKEVSRGVPLAQEMAMLDQAEEMVDKRKLKVGQTIGAAYVDSEGKLREIAIKEKYRKPSLQD